MNPYRAALKMVIDFIDIHKDSMEPPEQALQEVVKHELKEWEGWITADDDGLTPEQIVMAHEFPFEGGASGRRVCDACPSSAEVHMLVTRAIVTHKDLGGGITESDAGAETKEVFACKAHMLDPGPLLDW